MENQKTQLKKQLGRIHPMMLPYGRRTASGRIFANTRYVRFNGIFDVGAE